MSVEETGAVDIVSKDREGRIILTISDHLDWKHSDEHLTVLQEKISTYLRFLDSGEIFDKFPEARGRRILIQIMFHYKPEKGSAPFLETVKSRVESAGYGFRYEVFAATPFKT
ncbi:MAG: DUF6572 domain-containing protein [Terriglobales bacterium]